MMAQLFAIVSVFLMAFPYPQGQVSLHEKSPIVNNGNDVNVVAPIQLENYTFTVPVSLHVAIPFSTAGLPGKLDAPIDVVNTAAAFPAVAAEAPFPPADLPGKLKSRQQYGKFAGVLEPNRLALGILVVFVLGLVVVLLALRPPLKRPPLKDDEDYYEDNSGDHLGSPSSASSVYQSIATSAAAFSTATTAATTALSSESDGDNSGSSDNGDATTGSRGAGRPLGAPNIKQDRNPNGTLRAGQKPLKASSKRKREALVAHSTGPAAALEPVPQRRSLRDRR